MKFALTLAALALSSTLALAGANPAADACAAQLAAGPKQIFDQVAPDVKPASDIKAILLAKLKPMVLSGKLDRATAKADGASAATCLVLLK